MVIILDVEILIKQYLRGDISCDELASKSFNIIANDSEEFEPEYKNVISLLLHSLSNINEGQEFEIDREELVKTVKILERKLPPEETYNEINKIFGVQKTN